MTQLSKGIACSTPFSVFKFALMAGSPSQSLSKYERQRLENIKRNDEMMASLKLHSRAQEMSSATKPKRIKTEAHEKPKAETPIVIRRSLRVRRMQPDYFTVIRRSLRARGIPPDAFPNTTLEFPVQPKPPPVQPKPPPRYLGRLSMRDAYCGTSSDRHLIDSIMGMSESSPLNCSIKRELCGDESSCDSFMGLSENNPLSSSVKRELCSIKKECGGDGSSNGGVLLENTPLNVSVRRYSNRDLNGLTSCSIEKEGYRVGSSLNLRSLVLKPEKIARVVPGRVLNVRFFPTPGRSLVVAGNIFGNVGFWNVDCEEGEGDGIFLYRPHTGPISGILIQPFMLSKVFTSCYDGFIRLLDVEKESFNLLYSSKGAIFSLSQRPHDAKSLYFGEGQGGLNVWDERAGKISSSWILHDQRINTIDFHPENPNLMATSSSDGTVCIWDLRSIDAERPKTLTMVDHKGAVHSAYFSPSGGWLATTSINDEVGVLSGVDFADMAVIHHNNHTIQTNTWMSSFRAIWGWDDSYLFIGNMKRGVDVISPIQRRTMMTLESPHLCAIPCRFAAHPYEVGTLAGATCWGQVYVWTSS